MEKTIDVWVPLDEDEDLKNPFDDFMEVSTMYGGTAFLLSRYQDGEVIHLPCGYAICKIQEESDVSNQ